MDLGEGGTFCWRRWSDGGRRGRFGVSGVVRVGEEPFDGCVGVSSLDTKRRRKQEGSDLGMRQVAKKKRRTVSLNALRA